MAPPRIGSNTTNTTYDDASPHNVCASNSTAKPSAEVAATNSTTVETYRGPASANQPAATGSTCNANRHEMEKALARQEMLESALNELTPLLNFSAKTSNDIRGSALRMKMAPLYEALQTLPRAEVELAVRAAVQNAFPSAGEDRIVALTAKGLGILTDEITQRMALEFQSFIGSKIETGAKAFTAASKDQGKLLAMLKSLEGQTGEARQSTLAAWGLPTNGGNPSTTQLATGLTERAHLMKRNASQLQHTFGADHRLLVLTQYQSLTTQFCAEKKIDPDSLSAKGVQQMVARGESERTLRTAGEFGLAVGSAIAAGSLAAAVGASVAGSVALAAPVTLLNGGRKIAAADGAIDNAKAGVSAGFMTDRNLHDAEHHRDLVVAATMLELVAPAAVGTLLHGGSAAVHSATDVAAHGAADGAAAAAIGIGEVLVSSHDRSRPPGHTATDR